MYVRSRLAQAWGLAPWQIDDAPIGEVMTQVHIWKLEEAAQSWRQKHGGK